MVVGMPIINRQKKEIRSDDTDGAKCWSRAA